VIGLADTLAGRGNDAARVVLRENSPVAVIRGTTVSTPHGSVSAGLVLVAVDGLLGRILPELAALVRPVRLQMLATGPVAPGLLPYPIHLRWGFDYAQQDPGGRIFFGGGRDRTPDTEFTPDTEPSAIVQEWIEGQAAGLVGRPVRVTHRWAATAGYTGDGLPVLARPRTGVVACGGYCGTGNIVGVLAAKAALRWGLDGTPPPVWFTSAS
ncbi:MAG TPA: FAD-dependent oxidoreductase, partial [Nakamurella sp.]